MGNKILMSLIALAITTPVFASGIAKNVNPASCTSDVLETTSGTSNLQAEWVANTLHLEWYNGDNKLTVQEGATTCGYDSGITVPEEDPEREGYTFAGWKVRETFNLSMLEANIDRSGNVRRGHGTTCFTGTAYGSQIVDCETMSDLEYKEWSAEFEYGTFKGVSVCSTTQLTGSGEVLTEEPLGNGGYCWCNVTGFDANKDGEYVPITSTRWVSARNNGNFKEGNCLYSCAAHCAGEFLISSSIRRGHFGLTENTQE